MSWFDCRGKLRTLAAASAIAAAGLGLAACTSGPLYGTTALAPDVPGAASLGALRGRIAVALAGTRTGQIFRNALLFRLNGGEAVTDPVYEVRYTATGLESSVSIESGSGLPQAGLYRMTVTYQLVRLADAKVVDTGSRFATAPFDRTNQLFADQRAIIDARQQAGEAVAARVELAVAAAISRAGA